MDELLEYDNLIYSIIKKYEMYYDKDDLYQVGMMGLINAKRHYVEDKKTKFSTFAYMYIVGEVLKFVREDKTIKVSKDVIKQNQIIEKTKDILRQKLQREPTTLEISLILDMEEEKVVEVERQCQLVKSLDYAIEEDSMTLYNSVKTEDIQTKDEIMDLKSTLDELDPDEKKLIYFRYYYDYTQNEVSKELGMSQVQVSRKESKVLQKIKMKL